MHEPIHLIQKPTPCHHLERASAELGFDLYIKRDDLTGFALGGNKGRKLEYLMADALAAGADTVVTCGSTESNFVRHLAAACAVVGLACHVVTMDQPYEEGFAAPAAAKIGSAACLDGVFGLHRTHLPNGSWDTLFAASSDLATKLRAEGKNVYEIPIGGSSPVGAYAFFLAADELPGADAIVTATSSGSTLAGLHLAYRGYPTRVIGIACDPEPDLIREIVDLANGLAEMVEQDPVTADALEVRREFVGPGYGIPSAEGNEAIRWLAQKEGILLDPIYSGKAFAGLLAMARAGEFEGQTVIFWHTGGIPSLFSYGVAPA